MSVPIGPGDWVECIAACVLDPTNRHNKSLSNLTLGGIYQVEEVLADAWDDLGLVLVGVYNTHWQRAWRADRFRPIYRPNADLIESLLNQAPPVEIGDLVSVGVGL